MPSISNENDFNLSAEEAEKLAQFKEYTQIEDELKCVQILRLNDWDLQTSISQTLDGAYQAAATTYPEPSSSSSSTLRQRPTATNSNNDQQNEGENNEDAEVVEEPDEPGEPELSLSVYLWETASWLICLPFVVAFKTLQTIYDFVATLIMPSLGIDSTGTVSRFANEFTEKYGDVHPEFLLMKFEDALRFGKQEIKFVMTYIHSPTHRDTDRFCREILCNPTFVAGLQRRAILFWACSVKYPDGYHAFQKLRGSSFPFVALFALRNSTMTILRKFRSTSSLSTFTSELNQIATNYGFLLETARLEREQRDLDNQLRQQQDMAFQESLKADQEKARKKQEEEVQKAEEDRLRAEEEDRQRQREEKIKEMKVSLLEELRPEPEEENAEKIKIMFQLPGGKRLKRSFHPEDPVRHLYYFVYCNEETLINFKLHTNFPKVDLPGKSPSPDDVPAEGDDDDQEQKIKECNLGTNTVLFVYDLDS